MKSKNTFSTLAGLMVAVALLGPAQAEDKKAKEAEEMQAMMAKAKEAGTPGAEHAVLKAFEGNWNVSSRHWMKPKDKPQLSSATSSFSWVLDGRFLKQDFKGDWMGQSFTGLGFVGYNKIKKEYNSIWMDSMSTGIFESHGQYDAAAKMISDTGTFSCPVTGEKDMWFRSEWKIVSADKFLYSMYMKDPEGKEFKGMELTYQRAK